MVFVVSNIEPSMRYQTGYVLPDTQYPVQPVKIAELGDVVAVRFNDKRAFPFVHVCEVLGFTVTVKDGLITLTRDDETHTIDTTDNADFSLINGMLYATESVFNSVFGVSFRYFESVNLLQIFM